jgi:hypothetical protein
MTERPIRNPKRFLRNPADKFDEKPQRARKNKVYKDKIMKIAEDKNKAEAKEDIQKYIESIKGKIPAGLKQFAKDAIMGVKVEPIKKSLQNMLSNKANKPGGIEKSKPTKRLSVDDMNKNAPVGFKKGGSVKKKPKVAGRLAKRGYGISR